MTIEKTHIGIVITRDGPKKASRDGKYVGGGKERVLPQRYRVPALCREHPPSAFAGND
jgi:hypothetical protein